MLEHIYSIKRFLDKLRNKTDELQEFENKLLEILTDDLINDFTIDKHKKEKISNYLVNYYVSDRDYEHIKKYIYNIQMTLVEGMTIGMTQNTNTNTHKVIFTRRT